MTGARKLRRRVAALFNVINPTGSLTAKLAKLSPDHRVVYERWIADCHRYHASYPGEVAYQRLLAGEGGPQLRQDVSDILFGPTITIPADATEAQAAEIYQRMLKDFRR